VPGPLAGVGPVGTTHRPKAPGKMGQGNRFKSIWRYAEEAKLPSCTSGLAPSDGDRNDRKGARPVGNSRRGRSGRANPHRRGGARESHVAGPK
jgi:hypothetical protein